MGPGHKPLLARALVVVAVLVALSPFATPGFALAVGLVVALTAGNPWPKATKTISKPLLQASVVLLGFGTDMFALVAAARHGLVIAAATIALTFLLGWGLRRVLQIQPITATLLSAGTAICGGSAIAAVAAATAAAEAEIAVALGTVFMLNAVALFVFPPIGHLLGLTQVQFGTWAGIAIDDVSSVVAAASVYGPQALETATVVKLSRTLWIVPVALAARYVMQRRERSSGAPDSAAAGKRSITIPWFIALFVVASLAGTFVPTVHALAPALVHLAKTGMTLTLLLVGLTLSRSSLQSVGFKPVVHGFGLWLAISVMALLAVRWSGIQASFFLPLARHRHRPGVRRHGWIVGRTDVADEIGELHRLPGREALVGRDADERRERSRRAGRPRAGTCPSPSPARKFLQHHVVAAAVAALPGPHFHLVRRLARAGRSAM